MIQFQNIERIISDSVQQKNIYFIVWSEIRFINTF